VWVLNCGKSWIRLSGEDWKVFNPEVEKISESFTEK